MNVCPFHADGIHAGRSAHGDLRRIGAADGLARLQDGQAPRSIAAIHLIQKLLVALGLFHRRAGLRNDQGRFAALDINPIGDLLQIRFDLLQLLIGGKPNVDPHAATPRNSIDGRAALDQVAGCCQPMMVFIFFD